MILGGSSTPPEPLTEIEEKRIKRLHPIQKYHVQIRIIPQPKK